MVKQFSKKIEDFICQYCGLAVKGSGYTNHCPQCLYSKHVDINPGDRQASCQGLMEPVSVELADGQYKILYRCQVCGYERKNKMQPDDNFDQIIVLSNK